MSDFEGIKKFSAFSFTLLLGIGFTICLPSALAYTLTQTANGSPVRWQYGQKFYLAGNSKNASELNPDFIRKAVVNGLQQWKQASSGQFDFDYWQGEDPATYFTQQQQDGLNSIFFASQSRKKTDPNVIGYTQVWYNAENGNIIETDIILNDRDYQLTDSPSDTTSSEGANPKKVFLNNVITHELGHALGLSHSNSLNSSMLYVEFSEQYKLGCDDWIGVRHLYPSNLPGWGGIQGTLLTPTGEPLIGAVITAISKTRGIPIASAITNQQGFFEFAALESGTYHFMIEPFQGTPTSIPQSLRTREDRPICGNKTFPKNFVVDLPFNALKPFQVLAGRQSDAGAIRIQCSDLPSAGLEAGMPAPQAFIDRAEAGTKKQYTFQANGKFRITSLAYLLFSPIRVSLSLSSLDGQAIPHSKTAPLYLAKFSGFKIEDDSISGEAYGLITVELGIENINPKSFPSPAIWPGTIPYFSLIFTNESEKPVGSLPDNARCDPGESFGEYHSPPGPPVRFSTLTSSRDHLGFCGTAEASEIRKSRPFRTAPAGSILGWFLPFLVAIVCQLCLKVQRARLKS